MSTTNDLNRTKKRQNSDLISTRYSHNSKSRLIITPQSSFAAESAELEPSWCISEFVPCWSGVKYGTMRFLCLSLARLGQQNLFCSCTVVQLHNKRCLAPGRAPLFDLAGAPPPARSHKNVELLKKCRYQSLLGATAAKAGHDSPPT